MLSFCVVLIVDTFADSHDLHCREFHVEKALPQEEEEVVEHVTSHDLSIINDEVITPNVVSEVESNNQVMTGNDEDRSCAPSHVEPPKTKMTETSLFSPVSPTNSIPDSPSDMGTPVLDEVPSPRNGGAVVNEGVEDAKVLLPLEEGEINEEEDDGGKGEQVESVVEEDDKLRKKRESSSRKKRKRKKKKKDQSDEEEVKNEEDKKQKTLHENISHEADEVKQESNKLKRKYYVVEGSIMEKNVYLQLEKKKVKEEGCKNDLNLEDVAAKGVLLKSNYESLSEIEDDEEDDELRSNDDNDASRKKDKKEVSSDKEDAKKKKKKEETKKKKEDEKDDVKHKKEEPKTKKTAKKDSKIERETRSRKKEKKKRRESETKGGREKRTSEKPAKRIYRAKSVSLEQISSPEKESRSKKDKNRSRSKHKSRSGRKSRSRSKRSRGRKSSEKKSKKLVVSFLLL